MSVDLKRNDRRRKGEGRNKVAISVHRVVEVEIVEPSVRARGEGSRLRRCRRSPQERLLSLRRETELVDGDDGSSFEEDVD